MTELSKPDLRRNLIFNSIHECGWGFGMAFHTTYAIIPLFLNQLGAPAPVVISVAGLFAILFAVPQFASAVFARNIRNLKAAVIASHTLVMPPILMMAFAFAFFAPSGPYAWLYYYICFILYGLAIGFLLPIWAGFLHRATNRDSRGSFFGVSFAFNSIGGFMGGFLVKILLASTIPFPQNFGIGFFILFISIAVATAVFVGFRIKEPDNNTEPKTISQFIAETKAIFRTHSNFRRYLVARIFFTANFPVISLYAVFMQAKFGFDISTAGIFTILNVVALGLSSYLSGKIGDRFGHKTALIYSFSAYLLAIITALLAQSMAWVYIIFVFLGMGLGGFMPSSMNLVYEFAGDRDNKLYMAMIDTFLAPFILIALILAGSLSGVIPTVWLFIGAGILILIGLVLMAFTVKDPSIQSNTEINILT
jgi:MFS family permease